MNIVSKFSNNGVQEVIWKLITETLFGKYHAILITVVKELLYIQHKSFLFVNIIVLFSIIFVLYSQS